MGCWKSEAFEHLTPRVYLELRRMAARYMYKERSGNTLQATALVNEGYLRLIDIGEVSWQDRAHFFAVAANMMRRIFVHRARARGAAKRGGAALHLKFDETAELGSDARDSELSAIDTALDELAEIDARKAKVIELRFFGGLERRGSGRFRRKA